ncbi:MAG: diadenylate cyclase CdaA [Bacteroidales bacterium]|nr:diadenylate cyclase CdaA [Bacteroidales bacterium]
MLNNILQIRFVDVIDVILVAIFAYQIYRLVRGTNVLRIFWALLVLVLAWQVAKLSGMRLTGAILGSVVNVGLIALVVIFQPEIRKFLLFIGTKTQLDGGLLGRIAFWRRDAGKADSRSTLDPYIHACMHMSAAKTGALIIFRRQNEVEELVATGERIDARVSAPLLETLFFKNSPLHDGAVIVQGSTVLAARCILPVTSRTDIDPSLGLRHRSAIGVTEQLDVIAVVVSEETGAISYAAGGEISHGVSPTQLRQYLEANLIEMKPSTDKPGKPAKTA